MATAAAMKQSPYIFPRAEVKVELVQALPEDLKIFWCHNAIGKPVYKLRVGLIYWLKSSVTGKIETTPRLLTKNCNVNDIMEWLDCKMIWIAKAPFN